MSDLYQEEFDRRIVAVRSSVQEQVAWVRNSTNKDDLSEFIATYTAVVEPNFIPLMAAAHIRALSPEGKHATLCSLVEEIRDRYQSMLVDFALSVQSLPHHRHYRAVDGAVRDLRYFESCGDPLALISCVAALKDISKEFIPALEYASAQLGRANQNYTAMHGTADEAHRRLLRDAIPPEAEHYNGSHGDERVKSGVSWAGTFLHAALSGGTR